MEIATTPPADRRRIERRGGDRPAWRRRASRVMWSAWATLVPIALVSATVGGAVPAASAAAVVALVPAALVDVRTHRIPDPSLVIGAAVLIGAVAHGMATGADLNPGAAGAGAAVFGLPLLVLHLVEPASMGFGDVKAAIVLGAAIGIADWRLAPAALALATGVSAAVGLAARMRSVPLGPGLVTGAAIALLGASVLIAPSEPAVGGAGGSTTAVRLAGSAA